MSRDDFAALTNNLLAGISALEVGDVVEATIDGIGTLRNTVVSGK